MTVFYCLPVLTTVATVTRVLFLPVLMTVATLTDCVLLSSSPLQQLPLGQIVFCYFPVFMTVAAVTDFVLLSSSPYNSCYSD